MDLNLTEIPELSTVEAVKRFSRFPNRFYPARSAVLLVNGSQAYPEMLSAIESARTAVDLESYILAADRTGKTFQAALIRAVRRGVQIRVLYDWIGSLGLDDFFVQELIEAGVAVKVYHPLLWRNPARTVNRRDHRKILVVDGFTSFTGGINIHDDYAGIESGGHNWRDSHVRIEGIEIAAEMTRLFEYAWERATPYDQTDTRQNRWRYALRRRFLPKGKRAKGAAAKGGLEENDVAVKIVGNEEFRYRWRIHRTYLHAIRQARHYILLENAYFIPKHAVRAALAKAIRRGVTVAAVLNYASDVAACTYASRRLYSELLQTGVRIFEWPVGVLHAKTAVIDEAWSIVGSYNFDHRSLVHSLEAAAVIVNREFAQWLREQNLSDIAQCREITLAEHQRRPWRNKILEWFFYQFRYWL